MLELARRLPPALLLTIALGATPAGAQVARAAPREEPAEVATELRRLNATLTRIAALLEREVKGQRLDLMLKRLDLASRPVADLEAELSRSRAERSGLAEERQRLQNRLAAMAEGLERSDPSRLAAEAQAVEDMTRLVEAELGILDGRVRALDAVILELENDLARQRDSLEALRDQVDRELEGLE